MKIRGGKLYKCASKWFVVKLYELVLHGKEGHIYVHCTAHA